MSDPVTLRPRKDGATRLERVPSKRSQILSRFFDPKNNTADARKSKDELIKKGIYKAEAVFGNDLCLLPRKDAKGCPDELPEFLVRIVPRIEKFMATVGVYRINGDAAKVQKIRLAVDGDNYQPLEAAEDVNVLASALKLFFRELPEPLISRETRDKLWACAAEPDPAKLVRQIRQILRHHVDSEDTLAVMRYLMLHLHKVASVKNEANKMDSKNLATVFSPNLVHSATQTRRPESIMTEIEMNNVIVHHLIAHAVQIFQDL